MSGHSARDFFVILALLAVIGLSLTYAGHIGISWSKARAQVRVDGKLNTLIVSVCSLRRDLLTEYGHSGPEVMPNLEKFFRESTGIFSQLFNGIPWISIIAYFDRFMPELLERGHIPPGPFTEYPYVRLPRNKSRTAIEFRDTNDSNWEKDYSGDLAYLRNSFPLHPNRPFTLVVHVKYMHYPLIDQFNSDSEWDFYLSAEEKARLNEYLAHPERYYSKLPFLLMMTSDATYALAHPAVRAENPTDDMATRTRLLGLVTSERFMREWKASENYDLDLQILKKVYAANARYMDRAILGPLLNLFGDPNLKASTAVLFTGDHGEVHMERDKLTHATSPFDEALAIPAAFRFPDSSSKPVQIKEQHHLHTVAEFMRDVTIGSVHRENWQEKLGELTEDVFIMRNCPNSLHALRFKNKYKYVIDLPTGRRMLYDLEVDPGELHDIARSEPEVAERMEGLYWANLPRFKWIPLWRCTPWDATSVSF